MKRLLVLMLLLAFTAPGLLAGDKSKGSSELHFSVLKDENGKPVRNASVILHPVNNGGKQSSGGFQLKTDPEGHTYYDGVPYGRLRVQVIAHGFQTYGDDFDVNQPKQEIVIKLKTPQQQYTIYGDTPTPVGSSPKH